MSQLVDVSFYRKNTSFWQFWWLTRHHYAIAYDPGSRIEEFQKRTSLSWCWRQILEAKWEGGISALHVRHYLGLRKLKNLSITWKEFSETKRSLTNSIKPNRNNRGWNLVIDSGLLHLERGFVQLGIGSIALHHKKVAILQGLHWNHEQSVG